MIDGMRKRTSVCCHGTIHMKQMVAGGFINALTQK